MNKFDTWLQLKEQLDEVKEREAELRRELCAELLAEKTMANGRMSVTTMIEGYKWNAVQALNYKVSSEILQVIWPELTESERDAIRWVPELSLRIYKALPEDSILHEAVTTSLAMPQLKAELKAV